MWRNLSLANKSLLLFGGASALVIALALSAPWIRMNALVNADQIAMCRREATIWASLEQDPPPGIEGRRLGVESMHDPGLSIFERRAFSRLSENPLLADDHAQAWDGGTRIYRFAKAERDEQGDLQAVVFVERRSDGAALLLVVNTVYLLSAATMVLGFALMLFYLITHRLVLAPVRSLRETADRVRDGELDTRSDIQTGDEFQELASAFNHMLGSLQDNQDQLRTINAALDLKLNELAEMNTALYEAAKLKGEFLANVSHELRTPLNSIIGFAELLLEIAEAEPDAADEKKRKRIRYLQNIHDAGRNLLEMINSLLEMAKIEAGRAELLIEPMSLGAVCEALLGLIQPQADRRHIALRLEIAGDVPMLQTDVKKFQQIVFNFLSNAVKFTETTDDRTGEVTLRAERLPGRADTDDQDRIRVSVIDNGMGIPEDEQERIFQKFQQIDASHTRQHTGTGLGLSICRELATLLQAEIQLVSEIGRGSMFSLILPIELDVDRRAEQDLEAAFRGTLAGRRAWKA
ncbi:MAG: HAMP domain-containing protein [Phycisphaerales bacterium]|nr:HAMP domain-containing protein [Phycisphaerales bacterium]